MINKNKPNLIGGLGWHVGRYIGRLSRYLSTDYWWTVDWLLVDSRPIFDRYLTNTWPILDRYLADTWLILDRYLTDTWLILHWQFIATYQPMHRLSVSWYIGRLPINYRLTIDGLSTDYQLIVDPKSTDISVDCQPICWPRPPIVHMIHLFLCNNEELQMGYLGVMHNWIYVHNFCWSSYDLAFPLLTPRSKRRKSCCSKTSGFFSNKLSLDQGISLCFSSLILSCQRATAGWKQFTSPLTMTSLFWGSIFSDIVISLFDMLTSMKTGFAYSSTTEETPMSYFVVICGWFCNIQDHYVLVILQWTNLIQERSLYV